MSLQAIAGIAYDRRHPGSPSRVAAAKVEARKIEQSGAPPPPGAEAARQVNTSLEALKRYIPTELLALYLPFVSIAQDQLGKDAVAFLHWTYLGFLAATPFVVWLIYVAKAAESGTKWAWRDLPRFEAALATAAFAVWGATVPGIFAGQQWWLGLAAMASAVVFPLIDTAFGKKK